MAASDSTPAAPAKVPKQQLSAGMEHLRSVVTIPSEPANSGLSTPSSAIPTPGEEEPAYGVPSSFQPVRHAPSESSNNPHKRVDPFQFGSRLLEEGDDIFAYNAWDHVEVDSSYSAFIEEQTAMQRAAPVSEFDKKRFNDAPAKWWDKFYGNNKDNFFKDRKWLGQEFPLLKDVTAEGAGPKTILEVGAGAGNTAFPIVAMNQNEQLKVHACDFSKTAVKVMRESELYNDAVMQADVWDAAGEEFPPGLTKGSVDVVIMIFIFSALEPRQWRRAVQNVWDLLKPGGSVLFRDYGRGDLAQVRFKKGRYLEENFYVRGDGTRVYFFEKEELEKIWSGEMWQIEAGETEDVAAVADKLEAATIQDQEAPKFEVVNLGVDRRMLVNRQRRLKMYRCWMQGLFQKPANASAEQ